MRIISKVGPIQCGKDSATAYLVAGDGPIDVEMGRAGDESTLDRLIARCPEPPALEPALADAARARGLRVRDLALEHAEAKLSLALAMAIGPKQAPLSSDLVLEFADAAAAYFEAEVWSAFDPDECVLVRFEPSGRCVEACAMGQLGETFGLALYDEPGTIARMVAAGDDAASRAILKAAPTVSFTLDEEPAFLVEAMKDLTGAPVAPFLMRLEKGKPKPFDDGRLAELTAATRAFTALAEGQPGVGTAHLRSGRVTARAERAALARAPSETSAAKLVGRNEPCPCGSGKKYKTCHMGRDVPGDAAGLLHERDAALVERVLQRTVESQPTEAIKRFGREALGGRSVEPAFAMPLAAYEWVVDGRTPAAAFLERDGASLSASERTLIEAQLRSRLAPWEVLGVEPGSSLELLNLLTGERRTVREKSASKSLVQRDVLLGRVVDFPEVSLLGACHHVPLESGSAAAVVTRVTEQGATPGFEQSLALFRAWEEAAEEERVRREAPCRVVNADEHEVVFVEDEFRLEDGAAGVAASRVGALEGAERGASRRGSTAFSLVRPGSTGPVGGGPVIVGSVRITKTRLVASSNSLVRADALKARLIDALQDVATYRKRTLTPHPTMPGGATLIVDQQIHEDGVSDEMVRRRWLDTPLPTLEGKTPREAVELPALRPLVHRALKEQENAEARRSRGQVSDGGLPLLRQFRRELGLDELGGPRPHRELDAAIGFGRRMSETLLDFAAPLLGALQRRGGPLSQQAYDAAMHFAADVWNVSVMEAMGESEERLEALRAKLARSRLKAEHVEHLDALVRRKEAAFAADRRTVVELRLQQERGHLGIAVGAGLAPDLVERVRAAGLSPTP